MLSLYEILKASKTGIAPDMWTALAGMNWGGADSGHEVKEFTGIPPLSFTADGTPLLDYLISGNMSQTGTPTPTAPIQPSECGERTGNLWSNRGFSATTITSVYTHNISNNYGTTLSTTEGDEVTITQSAYPDFSKYAVGDVVTISFDYIVNEIHALSTQTTTAVYAGKSSNTIPFTLSSGDWNISGRLTAVITIIANMSPYVEVRLCGNSITVKNVMLNSGSTPLPYEPYGYKIPISSANTTTPIYLGEVQSTRQIKKLVLTGTDSDGITNATAQGIICITPLPTLKNVRNAYCTHYEYVDQNQGSSMPNNSFTTSGGDGTSLWFKTEYTTASDFKTYLATQYAAGTPVTIWYILAEPETAVVNEPLRKIGDYADTVSYEQAGVQIPTNRGNTVIDVLTELKPSEMYIKYQK